MMLFSYRFKKFRIRENDHVSMMARIFGNDTSTTFFGCVCLLGVIATIVRVQPAPTVAAEERRARLVRERMAMVRHLGNKIAGEAPPGAQVLLIDFARATGSSTDPMIERTREVLDDCFNNRLKLASVELFNCSPTQRDHRSIVGALQLTNKQFDMFVKRNPQCNVILSLVGLPNEFENSHSYFKLRKGEIMLAVYSEDIYYYGSYIASGAVTFCAAPKRFTEYDLSWEPSENTTRDFEHYHLLITKENLLSFAEKNRRMIWIKPQAAIRN